MFSNRKRLIVASAILVIGLALGFALDPKGIQRWHELGEELEILEAENEKLRKQNEQARRRISASRSQEGTDKALERAARERGYVRSDELLFEFRP